MKWFYELFPTAMNLPQAGVGFAEENLPQAGVGFAEENLPQAGVDSKQIIFCIPWGHNKLIIDRCKGNTEKAYFFAKKYGLY